MKVLCCIACCLLMVLQFYGKTSANEANTNINIAKRLKYNMQLTQIAAEVYAADHHGLYPSRMSEDFKMWFAGDVNGIPQPGGRRKLTNPVNNEQEWPLIGKARCVGDVELSVEKTSHPGSVEFIPIRDTSGKISSYAIRSFDENGVPLLNSKGKPFVISP